MHERDRDEDLTESAAPAPLSQLQPVRGLHSHNPIPLNVVLLKVHGSPQIQGLLVSFF